MQSQRWMFTINNYTPECIYNLRNLAEHDDVGYLVFGREVGEQGTPHLQGYIYFKKRFRRGAVARQIPRSHLDAVRGTNLQASNYCKKGQQSHDEWSEQGIDGPNYGKEADFEEFGQLPASTTGKTNRFDDLKKWVLAQPTKPTAPLIAEKFPSIYLQYRRVMEWIDLIYPQTVAVEGEFNECQQDLADRLAAEPDDRRIIFVVDTVGGTGKSWFIKKWMSMHPELTQLLSIGKRDDLAHAIDPSRRYFLFDLPRSQSEFLQYSVLEQLKDRFVFSPKYESRTKFLQHVPHVVVFMNERPDRNKLSADRYQVINWYNMN